MSTSTDGPAVSRSHGFSPWRLAYEKDHEALLAALDRKPSPPESSVSISRNARGVFQFEVVVRGADVLECIAQAEYTASELVVRYPYPNGDTAA